MNPKQRILLKFVELIEGWAEDNYISAESWATCEEDCKAAEASKVQFIKEKTADVVTFLNEMKF